MTDNDSAARNPEHEDDAIDRKIGEQPDIGAASRLLGWRPSVELQAGDVGYAPMGYGHYIESTGTEPLRMLLAFNSGTYEEIGLSSWFAGNPRQVVATNLGLTDDAAAELPTDETFISSPKD